MLKVITNRHKKTPGLYFDKLILQFLLDSQQIKYQKDKPIFPILNV